MTKSESLHQQIEKKVEDLSKLLKKNNYSLVTAESCTGGGLAYFISRCPECSAILERAYVVYSNKAKEDLLNVETATLQTHGSVSKQTAKEMSEGALKKSSAHVSIAITGIAGPDLPAPKRNKGIVWVSCSEIEKPTKVKKLTIAGFRKDFCDRTILESLKFFLSYLK